MARDEFGEITRGEITRFYCTALAELALRRAVNISWCVVTGDYIVY